MDQRIRAGHHLRAHHWRGLVALEQVGGGRVSEICLVCGEDYPPNGIVMCDDCGMDKDIEQQQEREGKK